MGQPEDLGLLKRCLSREEGAWEAFVSRFTPYLSEACRRILRRCGHPSGPAEVQDQVQAVFLTLLEREMRALREYQGRASLASYLSAIAVNQILERQGGLLPRPSEASEDPAAPLERAEALGGLREALSTLPARSRLALLLQADGASLKEIALSLGISPANAGQILSRARAELKKIIRN